MLLFVYCLSLLQANVIIVAGVRPRASTVARSYGRAQLRRVNLLCRLPEDNILDFWFSQGGQNNNNNNNNYGRRQGGVRKEEIQQCGTIALMRTVKNTHSIKLREKG